MNVALLGLAVWFALSILFAAAHCRLCRYAPVVRPPLDFSPKTWRSRLGQIELEPVGSDVADFFRSYARA